MTLKCRNCGGPATAGEAPQEEGRRAVWALDRHASHMTMSARARHQRIRNLLRIVSIRKNRMITPRTVWVIPITLNSATPSQPFSVSLRNLPLKFSRACAAASWQS